MGWGFAEPFISSSSPKKKQKNKKKTKKQKKTKKKTSKSRAPIVILSDDLVRAPEPMLRALCSQLGLAFQPAMLHWAAGAKPYDGCWAPWCVVVCLFFAVFLVCASSARHN